MTNPFDRPDGSYLVLVNDELQYSLWPATTPVPAGWSVAHDRGDRAGALGFIEETWTDMRPASLIRAMAADAAAPR
jgi:MbtH protein